MQKRQDRAAEYRRLAQAADALADASSLDHVREKHEQASARWAELAELDERPTQLPPPSELRAGKGGRRSPTDTPPTSE